MKNEENHNKSKDTENTHFWKFVKIKYEKIEYKNEKIIIVPSCSFALQVGNKFYLNNLQTIKKSKKRRVQVLERFNYIPAEVSIELIEYYKRHLEKRQNLITE